MSESRTVNGCPGGGGRAGGIFMSLLHKVRGETRFRWTSQTNYVAYFRAWAGRTAMDRDILPA